VVKIIVSCYGQNSNTAKCKQHKQNAKTSVHTKDKSASHHKVNQKSLVHIFAKCWWIVNIWSLLYSTQNV